MLVSLKVLDEWLFKGLGGIVNMMINRICCSEGFGRTCKIMLDSEIKRLQCVQEQVDARQIEKYESAESSFAVIDTWFVRSYTGINNWLAVRSEEGPSIDPSSLDDLQAHIHKIQEIVDRERVRRNQHHADAPS